MDGSPPNNSTQTMDPAAVEMNAARHSIVVKAPIGKAYEQWSRVEDLPKFITPLRNVKRIDETHFSYMVRQLPEQRTARCLSDCPSSSRAPNSLALSFRRFHVGRCLFRVALQ